MSNQGAALLRLRADNDELNDKLAEQQTLLGAMGPIANTDTILNKIDALVNSQLSNLQNANKTEKDTTPEVAQSSSIYLTLQLVLNILVVFALLFLGWKIWTRVSDLTKSKYASQQSYYQ